MSINTARFGTARGVVAGALAGLVAAYGAVQAILWAVA